MRNEIQRDRIIAFYLIPSMVNEYFPLVMTIILGGYYVYENRLSYGDFAVFIQILTYLSLPSSKYASALISFRSTQVSLDRFLSLDDQSEKDFDVDDVGKKENQAGGLIRRAHASQHYGTNDGTRRRYKSPRKSYERGSRGKRKS